MLDYHMGIGGGACWNMAGSSLSQARNSTCIYLYFEKYLLLCSFAQTRLFSMSTKSASLEVVDATDHIKYNLKARHTLVD